MGVSDDEHSAAQTKEEALDVLLLAVRRFLYPRPTPDAAELQVSRSIDKLVKAFHAWEVAAPACQAADTALADLETAYEVIVFADGVILNNTGMVLADLYNATCRPAQVLRQAGAWPKGSFREPRADDNRGES